MKLHIPYRSDKNYTSDVFIFEDRVTKQIRLDRLKGFKGEELDQLAKELFARECWWLLELADENIAPKLLAQSSALLQVVMTYEGERLSALNRPDDLYKQLFRINQVLMKHGCHYNDWKPENILVKDGTVKICDFGWCPMVRQDYGIKQFKTIITEKPGGELFMI